MAWSVFVFSVGLGDVCDGRLWFCRLWLGLCGTGDVEVDGLHVFPCSAVPFPLGLHNVAVWHGSLFNNGLGMYSSFTRDLKSTSCPGPRSMRSWVPWALLEYIF